jgi:hypothetical protein
MHKCHFYFYLFQAQNYVIEYSPQTLTKNPLLTIEKIEYKHLNI